MALAGGWFYIDVQKNERGDIVDIPTRGPKTVRAPQLPRARAIRSPRATKGDATRRVSMYVFVQRRCEARTRNAAMRHATGSLATHSPPMTPPRAASALGEPHGARRAAGRPAGRPAGRRAARSPHELLTTPSPARHPATRACDRVPWRAGAAGLLLQAAGGQVPAPSGPFDRVLALVGAMVVAVLSMGSATGMSAAPRASCRYVPGVPGRAGHVAGLMVRRPRLPVSARHPLYLGSACGCNRV